MPGTELRFDFFDALTNHAGSRPDEIALAVTGPEGNVSLSWLKLIAEIRGVSLYLHGMGIVPGDRVAILMENHPRWGVAFAAVQSAGAIAVPLDTISGVAAAVAVSRHAEAKFLLASPQLSGAAREIQAEVSTMAGTLTTEAEWSLAAAGGSSDTALPLIRRTLEDPLAILYTGGTTGRPKGVLLTQRNLYRSITDMLRVFPLSPADRILSVLPLFHVMPLLANLLAPLFTGAQVLFLNQLDPQSLMNTFASEGITGFLCVPQFYYQMERRILAEVSRQSVPKQRIFRLLLRISSFLRQRTGWRAGRLFFGAVHARFGGKLRAFGIGGAYMNPKTAAFFADLGFPLFQAYGLTESGGLASVTPLDRNGGLTCGQAVANCQLRVLNPDEAGVGEILIRGENVMQGYWCDPVATAAVLEDGWLHTGDLGTIDESGTLRLTGRAKDVIVLSSGKNIFPEELEEVFLKRCPLLQEVCFVGLEGPHGAILHCVAVANSGGDKQIRDEIAAAARNLPSYKRPGSLQITDQALPRTSTRKLQRFKIRDYAAAITSPPPVKLSAEQSSDPVEREIAALIGRMRAGAVNRDTHLELDLHLDSLERVELIANVAHAFAIDLTSSPAEINTVGDLIEMVRLCSHSGRQTAEWRDWTGLVRQPLTPEERAFASVYLRRRPLLEAGWYGFTRMVALGLRCTMRLKVGRRTGFPRPPFLLCPNHLSYLDDAVLLSALPFPVFSRIFTLAASKYLRGRFARWIASVTRVLPIDQDKGLLQGLRLAKAGLEDSLILCIFPEGTRSWDGQLQEIRKGSAILACALRLPVVPVGIDGTFEAWPRGRTLPRPHPISISIGEAIVPHPDETPESFHQRLSAALSREVQAAKQLRPDVSGRSQAL